MKDERTPEQRVRDRIRKGLLIHRDDAQALLDELDRYRTNVTTGGPGVPFTEQWENGPSSRPSTAPPEEVVVALPEGFGALRYGTCEDCGHPHPAWISCEAEARVGGVPLDQDPVYGEWCSEHGEEMQDHEHAVDYVDEPPPR